MINANGAFTANRARKLGGKSVFTPDRDSGILVKTQKSADRWTLEAAIPKKELGTISPDGFRANFGRHRVLSGTPPETPLYSWSPVGAGFHDLEKFGRLMFRQADGNLVKNGDFTADSLKGSWISSPGASGHIELDPAQYISGGRSIRLSGSGILSLVQFLKELKPNRTYAVSFFVRTENVVPLKKGGGAYVNLGDYRNDFRPLNGYTGNLPWTCQHFLWKTGTATNSVPGRYACIILTMRDASGTVWFDRVKIEELKDQLPGSTTGNRNQ